MDEFIKRLNTWWNLKPEIRFSLINSTIVGYIYIGNSLKKCITIYWDFENNVLVPHILSNPTGDCHLDQYIRYYALQVLSASVYTNSIFIVNAVNPLERSEAC